MKKVMMILPFLIGTITFTTSAQTASDRASIKDTFGIGPRLGYYNAQDADDGNFYGGIQARLRLGAVVGIEGAVDYRAGQEFGFDDYTATTRFVPVTGSLLLFAPINESFAPYGLAGIGAYYTIFDYSEEASDLGLDDDSSFNMGYHLGFGAEFPLSRSAALNVDYRYQFLNPDTDDESFEDADFNGNILTAGITFYF